MTPTKEQAERSAAKRWLRKFARPSVLAELAESMEDGLDKRMVVEVLCELINQEWPSI